MGINLIPGSDIIASGMNAERARMEIVANNLANANSTGTDKTVYRRMVPVFESVVNEGFSNNPAGDYQGVRISAVEKDNTPLQKVYSPFNPNADADGMVSMTNVSPITEMMDLITSTRAYEANLNAMKQTFDMANKTITLGKQS
jgi:flagellar basal-body rod protein FlgC